MKNLKILGWALLVGGLVGFALGLHGALHAPRILFPVLIGGVAMFVGREIIENVTVAALEAKVKAYVDRFGVTLETAFKTGVSDVEKHL